MALASPIRERAAEVMMKFVDTFVGVLIRVAADSEDPLTAVGLMLAGEDSTVCSHVATNEVRAHLFAAFNAYDINNARLLKDDALFIFLSDFVQCFSSSLAELGPDLATTPDESWEDRARWDAMGGELSARAMRLKAGFNHDPDSWVGRWSSMLDTMHDGKGLRYAEVQLALAGVGTAEWLKEMNTCASLTDVRGSPQHPLLLNDAPGRELSVQRSASHSLRRARHSSASPAAPEMTLDIADAACAMDADIKARRGVVRCLYYSLYFALLTLVLSLQMGSDAYHMQRLLVNNLVDPEYTLRKTLHDVRDVEDVWLWLQNVWTPFVFQDYALRRVAQSNVVAATPFLRQRRRRIKVKCEERVNIVVYDRSADSPCFASGFSSTAFTGNSSGIQYAPVDYDKAYYTPDPVGEDFLVTFPSFNASDTYSHYERAVSSEAEVATILQIMQADAWLGSQTAFLEANVVLYNADTETIGVSRVVFSQTSAGGIVPFADDMAPFSDNHHGSVMLARRANRFRSNTSSYVQVALEGMLVLVTVVEFFIFEVLVYIDSYRRTQSVLGYFKIAWSYVQLLYYCVFVTYVGLYITYASLPEPDNSVNSLENFSNNGLDSIYPVMLIFGGILVVTSMVRVLRYVGSLTSSIYVVSGVIEACWLPLMALFVLFMVAVVVFAVVGYYFYGHGFVSFSTMGNAVQMVVDFIIRGIRYSDLNNPLADPSQGVFTAFYYWSLVIVLTILFMSLLIAVFVASYDAVMDRADQRRKENLDIPSTGRPWSRKSLLNSVMNYSSTLLNTWRINNWVVPVATDWKFDAVAAADIVQGTNLRVVISTPNKEAIASCTGIIFITPREMLKNDLSEKRGNFVPHYALFTRCIAGREPHLYNKRDWCRYTPEWWMQDQYVHDFVDGGFSWTASEEGSATAAVPTETHRRTIWLSEHSKGHQIPVVDPRHFVSTQLVPFEVGSYRSRVLRIQQPCSVLFQGPEWEHESLVFEFRDVVSPKWHTTKCGSGVKQLPVNGVYRTYRPLQVSRTEFQGSKLVVVLGDQKAPEYVCEMRERQTATAVKATCSKGTVPFAEDMVIARFGVSNERPTGLPQ